MRNQHKFATEKFCKKTVTNGEHCDIDMMVQVSEQDTLYDLMVKSAVIHLTNFYQLLRNDYHFYNVKCTKAVSHYEALYFFKQGQYATALKLCEAILEEEIIIEMREFSHRHGVFRSAV